MKQARDWIQNQRTSINDMARGRANKNIQYSKNSNED